MGRMVQLQDVELRYRHDGGRERLAALRAISFSIEAGGFRWLLGASGAGKSSLLRLLHLTERPSAGRLSVLGREIAGPGGPVPRRHLPLLRRRIGMVFQDFRLIAELSAFDNVAVPLRLAGHAEVDVKRDVAEMLQWVGLERQMGALPATLSGGEQQRVAIARAVVARPSLLLADEPTGNLDELQAERLMRLLREMNRHGATVVVATHNQALVERHPAPALVLERGRLVEDGT